VSGSEDNSVRIWDAATGQCTSVLERHSSSVWSVSWSHDGTKIASGFADNSVRIWDVATGECLSELKASTADDALGDFESDEAMFVNIKDLDSGGIVPSGSDPLSIKGSRAIAKWSEKYILFFERKEA